MAEDLVFDPDTATYHELTVSGTDKKAFYPDNDSSYNNVTIGFDIEAAVLGGYGITHAAELVETNYNTIRVGNVDPAKRIDVLLSVQGAQAVIYTAKEAGAVARSNYNRLYVTNVSTKALYGGSVFIIDSPGSIGYSEYNVSYIVNSTVHYNDIQLQWAAGGSVEITADSVNKGQTSNGSAVVNHNTIYFINSWGKNLAGAFVRFFRRASQDLRQDVEASYNHVIVIDSGPQSMSHAYPGNDEPEIIAGAFVLKNSLGYVQAHHNSVTLQGDTKVRYAFGTYFDQQSSDPTPASDMELFLGNTLNIVLPKEGGIEVTQSVSNFQFYNFTFSSAAENGAAGLKAGDRIFLSEGYTCACFSEIAPMDASFPVESRKTRIGYIDLSPDGDIPPDGQVYELMSAENGIIPGDFDQSEAEGQMGPFILLKFDLKLAPDKLFSILRGALAHPQLKDPVSGGNGSLALVVQGSDLIFDEFLEPVTNFLAFEDGGPEDGRPGGGGKASANAFPEPKCPRAAFAVSYGESSYENGGDLDLESLNAALGVACERRVSFGLATFGVFAEGGRASYDSAHKVSGYDGIEGDGETGYFGGGLGARLDFNPGRFGRFYLQGAGRFGRVDLDYRTDKFSPMRGNTLSYDAGYAYRGAYFGSGFLFPAGKNVTVDSYMSYMWTTLGKSGVTTNIGERLEFEQSSSRIARAGARLTGTLGGSLSARVGFNAVYEFDGETRASTRKRNIAPASLKGTTGALELGLDYRKNGSGPFTLGVSFQTFAGKRKGARGSVNLSYSF
jgi:hypothetical protein